LYHKASSIQREGLRQSDKIFLNSFHFCFTFSTQNPVPGEKTSLHIFHIRFFDFFTWFVQLDILL